MLNNMFVSCTLKKLYRFNTQQRFAEHTGDPEFIVVLIMCVATIFSVGTEGLYLSIFCESQEIFNTVLLRLARSHQSLDNSFHQWHILLFVPFEIKKCVFWRIWSKANAFVVICVIQCTTLSISSVPTMAIYVHVLNYAYHLLCIKIISYQK